MGSRTLITTRTIRCHESEGGDSDSVFMYEKTCLKVNYHENVRLSQ